jgi:hypothetical protein
MAGCSSQSFTNVNQTVWNCLVAEAQSKYGITISTPSGSASKLGVTLQWNWSSANSTLTMQCTDKPFLIGCGTVQSAITDAVTGCGGTAS